ncbi:hypothetical protein GLOIN_2v1772576 [Rhizophagus clarus]|uniref:Uncharacterized protein n=1 Tax=Rhizophagus clarus TaxID=94130 RepID=A0A8H3KN70_9GLOM|nr:hypothetical protein GLOIN_2v1772576 [Rhizophagus clarus]
MIGGYIPIIRKSDDSYGTIKDSYFKKKHNIEDHISGRVNNEKYVALNSPEHGLSFGFGYILDFGIEGQTEGIA